MKYISVIQSSWGIKLADQFINLLLTILWNRDICEIHLFSWSVGIEHRLSKGSLIEKLVYLLNFEHLFSLKPLTIVYFYNRKREYFPDKNPNQLWKNSSR